jgi:hypothetical protein
VRGHDSLRHSDGRSVVCSCAHFDIKDRQGPSTSPVFIFSFANSALLQFFFFVPSSLLLNCPCTSPTHARSICNQSPSLPCKHSSQLTHFGLGMPLAQERVNRQHIPSPRYCTALEGRKEPLENILLQLLLNEPRSYPMAPNQPRDDRCAGHNRCVCWLPTGFVIDPSSLRVISRDMKHTDTCQGQGNVFGRVHLGNDQFR